MRRMRVGITVAITGRHLTVHESVDRRSRDFESPSKNSSNFMRLVQPDRLLDEKATPEWIEAVTRLSRLSISASGRAVLSKAQSSSYFPVAQTARKAYVPPAMDALRTAIDPWDYARRALSVRSPFGDCSPSLPADLRDAVRFTVQRGNSISEWRL